MKKYKKTYKINNKNVENLGIDIRRHNFESNENGIIYLNDFDQNLVRELVNDIFNRFAKQNDNFLYFLGILIGQLSHNIYNNQLKEFVDKLDGMKINNIRTWVTLFEELYHYFKKGDA